LQILIGDDLILSIEQETQTNPWTRQAPEAYSAFDEITWILDLY
jgi:hypothetical protein